MPTQTEGGESWLVVIGVIAINLAIFPVVQCFGLIYEDVFEDLNMSAVDLTFLIHINSVVSSISGLLCAPIFRRCNYRMVCLAGCFVCCVAICLMSQARYWVHFVLTYSLLYAVGQGPLFPSTSVALNAHFKVRRRLAIGLTVAITSFGPVISPYIVNMLLSNYGTSGTVLLLGGVALHSLVGGMLLREHPSGGLKCEEVPKTEKLLEMNCRRECIPDNNETKYLVVKSTSPINPATHEVEQQHIEKTEGEWHFSFIKKCYKSVMQTFDLDLFKDPVFVNIATGMGISIASEFNFQMLLPFILMDMADIDRHSLATVMSVQAGADITARIMSPFLADWLNLNSRFAYVLSLGGATFGRIVLAHFHQDYKVIIIHAIIFGSFKGFKAVFQSLILPDCVPLNKLPAASGLYMIINGVLSMVCGPLIGLIRDNSASYISALYATSALSLLCPISWAAEYFYQQYRKHDEHALEEGIK